MTFKSILFPEGKPPGPEPGLHDVFTDLNLDQVVAAVTADREEYNLRPFFQAPLKSLDAIEYRREVMQDLEDKRIHDAVASFAERLRTMRKDLELAKRIHNRQNKQGWFLDAVELYCEAVNSLLAELTAAEPKSRGLSSFVEFLRGHVEKGAFASLFSETKRARADLSGVRYTLLIGEGLCTVGKYDGGPDYGVDVEKTFEKFKEGAVKDYRTQFAYWPETNRVESAILDLVAKLYPEVFQGLDAYCTKNAEFVDPTLAEFDREVQFYVAYLDLVSRLRAAGLQFCYPQISDKSKEVSSREGFDLALAVKLSREGKPIVTNDFYLKGRERIFVVNGPNQGGKTTFARAFGQLHYLASLGCPVPGREARLFMFDRLFTHFEREESLDNLRSKLEDDLVRIHAILTESTTSSIIVVNEEFSSSTVHDAVFLGRKVLERIVQLDALCVYVTFLDELSTLDKAVSVLSSVVPDHPETRTYKIVRRQADGLAYAVTIANKYQLSYEKVKERIVN